MFSERCRHAEFTTVVGPPPLPVRAQNTDVLFWEQEKAGGGEGGRKRDEDEEEEEVQFDSNSQ